MAVIAPAADPAANRAEAAPPARSVAGVPITQPAAAPAVTDPLVASALKLGVLTDDLAWSLPDRGLAAASRSASRYSPLSTRLTGHRAGRTAAAKRAAAAQDAKSRPQIRLVARVEHPRGERATSAGHAAKARAERRRAAERRTTAEGRRAGTPRRSGERRSERLRSGRQEAGERRTSGRSARRGASASRGMSAVIAYARAQVGKRYASGADGPDAFDCSGFTKQAYRRAGLHLPHSSAGQAARASSVSRSEARPGDLVVGSGHVGVYMGGGMMIDAGNSRVGVVYRAMYSGLHIERF